MSRFVYWRYDILKFMNLLLDIYKAFFYLPVSPSVSLFSSPDYLSWSGLRWPGSPAPPPSATCWRWWSPAGAGTGWIPSGCRNLKEGEWLQLAQYPDQSRGELISDGSEQRPQSRKWLYKSNYSSDNQNHFWTPHFTKISIYFQLSVSCLFIGNLRLTLNSGLALTSEPAGVDVVGAVVLVAGAEEDSVAVCGQEVRWPVLALVTDLQRGAVLSLARVIRANKLENGCLFRCDAK